MALRDLFGSLVRTGVPYGVGFVLTWLGRQYGIVLDDGTSAQLSAGAAVLAGTAYYALVRAAESRWKWVGWLLGWNVPPTYTPPAAAPAARQVYPFD